MENREELIEKNMNLVYYIINRYYPNVITDEDIIQEGMIGLIKAADTFEEGRAKFSTYASSCIRNAVRREFERRNKHKDVISLQTTVSVDNEDITLMDTLVGERDVDYVDDSFFKLLNPQENYIIERRLDGLNRSDIAKEMGLSPQRVSEVLRIVKRKWDKYYADKN